MHMARTFIFHVSFHWSEYSVNELALWPIVAKHATWLCNRMPSKVTGLTPIELLTMTHSVHCDLFRTHAWRYPTFVLDPKVQNGQKIAKWNSHALIGQFLDFSGECSSLVANVKNLRAVYVSPQYDVVLNDLFSSG